MKLIDTYRNVEKREILDCRIKSLKEWLRHYGCKLSSLEILLICRGMTFSYDKVKVPDIFNFSLPYASVSHAQIEETFFDSLGIKYKKEAISGSDKGWENIKSLIDSNMPILFKIDSRFLKQDGLKGKMNERLNLYYVSTLLLVGYNLLEDEVYVILNSNDIIETYNKISFNEFQKYRSTVCRPFSPNDICYYVENENKATFDKEIIYLKTIEGLRNIIVDMVNNETVYRTDLGSFIGEGTTKGVFAMKKLKDDLEFLFHECRKHKNFSMLQLASIFLRNNLMFGSYSAFRFEFSQCLKLVAEKYGMKRLYKKSESFLDISNYWRSMFIQLSKITHDEDDIYSHFTVLLKIIESIIQKESEQYLDLLDII